MSGVRADRSQGSIRYRPDLGSIPHSGASLSVRALGGTGVRSDEPVIQERTDTAVQLEHLEVSRLVIPIRSRCGHGRGARLGPVVVGGDVNPEVVQ